jgi:hypothetical protein
MFVRLIERNGFAPLWRPFGHPHLPSEQLSEDLLQGSWVTQIVVMPCIQKEYAFVSSLILAHYHRHGPVQRRRPAHRSPQQPSSTSSPANRAELIA